jgi:hypothetical protein
MKLPVKSLNEAGMGAFREYLGRLRENPAEDIPYEFLNQTEYVSEIRGYAEVDTCYLLGTRWAAGQFLVELLRDVDGHEYSNSGLWAWLSLAFFGQLCPIYAQGKNTVGEEACYIPSTDYKNYYRHKLLGPFNLYRRHGIYASALLTNPVHTVGDVNETIASRQEFVQNHEMMKVVHRLYYDEEKKSFKRGTTTKEGRRGSAHRLWAIKEQLDLTYDFFSMACDDILRLLPEEFDSWWKDGAGKNTDN